MALNQINTVELFTAEVIAKNTNVTSEAVNIREDFPTGFFSIYVIVAGSGTAKIEYLLSLDGTTFLIPSGADDIVTAMTAGSDILPFSPELAKQLKIKVTETGTSDPITVTIILAFQ